MNDNELSVWLSNLKKASQEEINKFSSEPDFTPFVSPNAIYSRYVDEYSVVDHGSYIYFKGAGTAGSVCAGFTSGYQVPKLDIVTRGPTQNCPDNFRPYFYLTYRVAG
jgi:hypothetical protein